MLFFLFLLSVLALSSGEQIKIEFDFEETYYCDEMESESRALLISPQENYLYDRYMVNTYPKGMPLMSSGIK